LKSLHASRWLVACLRRRGARPRRRTLGGNARQRRFQSSNFHPSWRARAPMNNSFANFRLPIADSNRKSEIIRPSSLAHWFIGTLAH
jgi:hypothetical protein